MNPDLPILGEPFVAEFANTLYADRNGQVDVLDHPDWIAAWFAQAPCAAGLKTPRQVRTTDVERLRLLRNAIRGLLLPNDGLGRQADLAVVNHASGLAQVNRVLEWRPDSGLGATTASFADAFDTLLSTIAIRAINAVETGEFGLTVVCSRPGCQMFYFRDHHRRRYCNERCANADRQARYNQRLHDKRR